MINLVITIKEIAPAKAIHKETLKVKETAEVKWEIETVHNDSTQTENLAAEYLWDGLKVLAQGMLKHQGNGTMDEIDL